MALLRLCLTEHALSQTQVATGDPWWDYLYDSFDLMDDYFNMIEPLVSEHSQTQYGGFCSPAAPAVVASDGTQAHGSMESWSSQLAQRARAQDSGLKAAVNIAISQYSATARKPPGERSAMSLVSILVALIVVGVLLWLVNQYIPMDRKIKTIFNVVVVVAVVLWLLYGFGVLGRAGEIRLPRIR